MTPPDTTGDSVADVTTDGTGPDAVGDATNDVQNDGGDDTLGDTPGDAPVSDTVADAPADSLGDTVADAADAGDSGTVDGDATPDAGIDIGTWACSPECAIGEICGPGGHCVNDCSIEYPAFDPNVVFSALASGWDVVAMHCGGNLAVTAFEPLSATEVLELVGVDGSPDSTLNVDKVTFVDTPTIENVTTSVIAGSIDAFEVFPGLRLEADSTGEVFGYGYTGAFDVSNLYSPGELLFGSLLAPGAPTALEASSNYGLAPIDKDNWLISARSVNNVGTEAGVYMLELAGGNLATRVAGGLGFATGNVAKDGDIVLLGGYADPWPSLCGGTTVNDGTDVGNKVFYTPMTALTAAKASITPIDTFCDAQEVDGIGSDFSFLDNGRLISVNIWNNQWLTVHFLEVDGSGDLNVATSIPVAKDDTLANAKGIPGSDGQIMIQTSTGYMVVAPTF